MQGFAVAAAVQSASSTSADPFWQCAPGRYVPVPRNPEWLPSWGAKGDGVTDDTEAVVSALTNRASSKLEVPAGTYVLRNPIVVCAFSGMLVFRPGATFLFTDPAQSGLAFAKGSGGSITGYRADWLVKPRRRLIYGGGLVLGATTGISIRDCVVRNSPAAGVVVETCVSPRLEDVVVSGTLADGVHFANCRDASISNLQTDDTGDDGLAFVNYSVGTANRGGTARKIRVRRSRTRGIAVVGQSNVRITDFSVDTTGASGIYCAHEKSYQTRVPEDVLFADGEISNAGMREPRVGNQYGVGVHLVKSAQLRNIKTQGSYNCGLFVHAPAGKIDIRGLSIADSRNGCGATLSAEEVRVIELAVRDCPRSGVLFTGCGEVYADALSFETTLHGEQEQRAVWTHNNRYVEINGISVQNHSIHRNKFLIGGSGDQVGLIRGVRERHRGPGQLAIDSGASPRLKIIR